MQTTTTSWQSLLSSSFVAQLLISSAYPSPSAVQVKALPLVRLGVDVVVHARAGTGKTLVFAIATAERALDSATNDRRTGLPRVLFVAPTREIALQGAGVLSDLSSACGMTVVTCIGGLPVAEDERLLRKGCDVVLGTPGRLAALMERNSLDVSCVDMVVLDEADRLTESPFYVDVKRIVGSVRGRPYQLVALSATFESPSVERLEALRSDEAVAGGKKLFVCAEMSTPPTVAHYRLLTCDDVGVDEGGDEGGDEGVDKDGTSPPFSDSTTIIRRLTEKVFGRVPFRQAIVFCPSRRAADAITKALVSESHAAALLSSDMDQLARIRALNDLRQYRTRILVCTDVAARGIDLPNVDLVCNVGGLPTDASTLKHRIGRAGRFGQPGVAVTLVNEGWGGIGGGDGNASKAVEAMVAEALDFREYRGAKVKVDVDAPESVVVVRHIGGDGASERGVVGRPQPAAGRPPPPLPPPPQDRRVMEASLFTMGDEVLEMYASHFDMVVQSCSEGMRSAGSKSLGLLSLAYAKVEDVVDASTPGFNRNARSLGTVQSRGLEASLAEPEDVLMAVLADRGALARESEALERMLLG